MCLYSRPRAFIDSLENQEIILEAINRIRIDLVARILIFNQSGNKTLLRIFDDAEYFFPIADKGHFIIEEWDANWVPVMIMDHNNQLINMIQLRSNDEIDGIDLLVLDNQNDQISAVIDSDLEQFFIDHPEIETGNDFDFIIIISSR